MDQRKVLFLAGALGILLLVIIIGTIVYISSSRSADNTSGRVVTSSPLSIPSATIPTYHPSAAPSTPASSGDYKTYSGNGFAIRYPKTWGLLTCTNSQSFEFDPQVSADQSILCGAAQKPITVLVHNSPLSCPGQIQTFGTVTTTKSVDPSGGRTDYRYCTQTTPQLDITTRYSPNGGPATATTDYSQLVEQQLIPNIHIGNGS